MKVIFIAAGYGSRLKQAMPKPLVEVNGLSILERQISLFQQYGINDIIIIVGPEKEKFNLKNVTYIHDVDFDKHEQLGSLMAAKSEINNDSARAECYVDQRPFIPYFECNATNENQVVSRVGIRIKENKNVSS